MCGLISEGLQSTWLWSQWKRRTNKREKSNTKEQKESAKHVRTESILEKIITKMLETISLKHFRTSSVFSSLSQRYKHMTKSLPKEEETFHLVICLCVCLCPETQSNPVLYSPKTKHSLELTAQQLLSGMCLNGVK